MTLGLRRSAALKNLVNLHIKNKKEFNMRELSSLSLAQMKKQSLAIDPSYAKRLNKRHRLSDKREFQFG